jgi:hypothetical protein
MGTEFKVKAMKNEHIAKMFQNLLNLLGSKEDTPIY